MPIFTEPKPALSFQISPATDLFWALSAAHQKNGDACHAPELDGSLAERAKGLWSDSSCFSELILLAKHGGVLFGDIDRATLVSGVGAACDSIPLRPRLATETEHERHTIWARLSDLRNDPDRRAAYLELLDDVWAATEGTWREELAALSDAQAACEERSRRNQSWKDLFKKFQVLDEFVQTTFDRSEATGDDVVVVVCAFGGAVTLDLEGLQLIGLPIASPSRDPRTRAAAPARRFRALGDPTRLALLELVARAPSSVGALARELGVSQPTVSNHVKVLIEAGLVTSSRTDRRSVLLLNESGIDEMLAEATSILQPR